MEYRRVAMIEASFWVKPFNKLSFLLAAFAIGCTTGGSTRAGKPLLGRTIASEEKSPFGYELDALGLNVYFANLHAHHFMEYGSTKKQPNPPNISSVGECPKSERFPQDDGRPCRSRQEDAKMIVPVPVALSGQPSVVDYFKMACDYAKTEGGLDILFVTPHTKTGEPMGETDTIQPEFRVRQERIAGINQANDGKFYCGLGQEASSIGKGNHVGIYGHFRENSPAVEPFYFPAGAFGTFYSQVKNRSDVGEAVILQLNHPDSRNDLWWEDLSHVQGDDRFLKKHMRDYGIDDFPPVGCIVQKQLPGCSGPSASRISNELLRTTYTNIRKAAGDRFRLIEIVPTIGATSIASENFKPVHQRQEIYPYPDAKGQTSSFAADAQPFYDYVFYLNMGFKLGPTANQDNHFMNWGSAIASRTGLLATSLKEEAVFQAMDRRRSFATEDRNAKMIFYAQDGSKSRREVAAVLMGGETSTTAESITLAVGYQDPDGQDENALLRVYYYRENENLDFRYKSDPRGTLRLVSFDSTGKAQLPSGPVDVAQLRDPAFFSREIRSGDVHHIEIPVEKGGQYVFIEIAQSKDFDRLVSAPIWITKD